MTENKQVVIKTENDLQNFLHKNYMKKIQNFFNDEKQAMKFLSSVMLDVQRNPKLLECTPMSIVNSYMMMAQLGFMPSGVSGEAYVLPYSISKKDGDKWVKVMEAQFQLGYQGLVTLFYKAGVEKITSAIVRKNDITTFINGELKHEIDITLSSAERGAIIGAYSIVSFKGKDSTKFMNAKDILAHGAKFSKSFDVSGKYSPWNPENDPEGWMFVKTVLKQHAKLLPKNETIYNAIAEDNKDSVISDRIQGVLEESQTLKMGALNVQNNEENKNSADEENQDGVTDAESDQTAKGFKENTIKRD